MRKALLKATTNVVNHISQSLEQLPTFVSVPTRHKITNLEKSSYTVDTIRHTVVSLSHAQQIRHAVPPDVLWSNAQEAGRELNKWGKKTEFDQQWQTALIANIIARLSCETLQQSLQKAQQEKQAGDLLALDEEKREESIKVLMQQNGSILEQSLELLKALENKSNYEEEKKAAIEGLPIVVKKSPQKTLYDLLGVDKKATQEEIREAYQKFENRYQAGEINQAALKFIKQSYQILSDPEKRAQYDQSIKPKDYYLLLNIAKEASAEDIKASYRRLCVHYDVVLDLDFEKLTSEQKHALEQFKDIQNAYLTLSDSQKRADYDQSIQGWGEYGVEQGIDVAGQLPAQSQSHVRSADNTPTHPSV